MSIMDRSKNTTVRALIEFLPTGEKEGRRTPINCKLSYYRPDHNFPWLKDNEMYMGQVSFTDDRELLFPGDSAEVIIGFCSYPELDAKLKPGITWKVKEGMRTVGIGKLIEIISM